VDAARSPLPAVQLRVKGRTVTIELPQDWMKEHPLTLEDLEQERLLPEGRGLSPQHRSGVNRAAAGPQLPSAVDERHAFVVQGQETRLGANRVGGVLGTNIGARRIHDPCLSVVGQIQLQIVGDA